ncbi:MAG: HAMP domain-containing histidine kinase [Planctomycetes bacterium]|nr:HAMP domain-containing histidine kinase [Planctomycetota bacterium]
MGPRRKRWSLRWRLALWTALLLACVSVAKSVLVFHSLEALLLERLDRELLHELEEWRQHFRHAGLAKLREEFESEAQEYGPDTVVLRFFDAGGVLVLESGRADPSERARAPLSELASDRHHFTTRSSGAGRPDLRFLSYRDAAGFAFEFGHSLADHRALTTRIVWLFVLSAGILSFFGALGVSLLCRNALLGLESITRAVRRTGEGDLGPLAPEDVPSSEIQELAQAFQRMQSKLQSMIAELRDMSINVAHDLRGPLTAIRCAAETALTSKGSDEIRREALEVTIEQCDRLVGIVDTLLEIAEAEACGVAGAAEVVDLSALLRGAAEIFEPVAQDAGLRIELELPDAPSCVRGVESKLQRVFANLVENAIKFTPAGGRIAIRLEEQGERVRVEIADTGVGIPESALPFVFDRFYKADPSRHSPGNGLGLSYVASIVKAHGGEVVVRSEVHRGTTFAVVLPRARV